MTRVERLINLLRLQGIEVGRAPAEVKLQEGTFPAGSFIVKRDQPYSRLAKTLLEKQVYPDPNLRTYDDTSWTMGLMSHAEVKEIADKKILDLAVEPVKTAEIHLAGTLTGSGPTIAVAHNGSNNMITLRYRLKDLTVQAAEKEFKQGDVTFPAGSFVIAGDAARVRTDGRNARADGGGAAVRAAGAAARSRSAAPRDLQHLGQHAGGRLGALRVRQVRGAVRPDLQGAREEGRPERVVRRHPDAEPGRQRQAARLRHRESRAADRVQEERSVQEPRHVRRVGRHHRRHGPRRRRRDSRSS